VAAWRVFGILLATDFALAAFPPTMALNQYSSEFPFSTPPFPQSRSG